MPFTRRQLFLDASAAAGMAAGGRAAAHDGRSPAQDATSGARARHGNRTLGWERRECRCWSAPNAGMVRDLAAGCHFQFSLRSLKGYYTPGPQLTTREGARINVALFQDWNRATGTAELVSHEFVQELNGPYRARFSDGSEALVNLTTEIREIDGQTLQPGGLHLHFADGRRIQARPKTGWDVEPG